MTHVNITSADTLKSDCLAAPFNLQKKIHIRPTNFSQGTLTHFLKMFGIEPSNVWKWYQAWTMCAYKHGENMVGWTLIQKSEYPRTRASTHKRGALCGCLSDQVTHDQNRIDDQKSDDDAIQQSVDVRRKFQRSGIIGNFHHDYHNQQHDLQSQKGRVVSTWRRSQQYGSGGFLQGPNEGLEGVQTSVARHSV